jgi:hypothetical protein
VSPRAAEVAGLLAVARDAVRQEMMPRLAGEDRYRAAMVANAIAIAIRALEAPEDGSEEARRRLAADIRAGRVGPEAADLVEPALRRSVEARLRISNPGALEPAGDKNGRRP